MTNHSGADTQQPQRPVDVSPIDEKDRHDILIQQIIDDLAQSSRGHQHEQVVAELASRIAEQNLPTKPRPWLNAVAAAALMGNAYVVTPVTAQVCDVPPPSTDRSGESIT